MNKGQMAVKETVTKVIEYAACVKCGSTDVKFYNCGYSSFNVSTAKCKCGNEVVVKGLDCNAPDSEMIPHWNKANDPDILRKKYQAKIDRYQRLIDELPKS